MPSQPTPSPQAPELRALGVVPAGEQGLRNRPDRAPPDPGNPRPFAPLLPPLPCFQPCGCSFHACPVSAHCVPGSGRCQLQERRRCAGEDRPGWGALLIRAQMGGRPRGVVTPADKPRGTGIAHAGGCQEPSVPPDGQVLGLHPEYGVDLRASWRETDRTGERTPSGSGWLSRC